jgi:hypothetical protein
MTEPRSNVTLTDQAGLNRYRLDTAITELTETASSVAYAMTVLKKLAERDTEDKVFGRALLALDDAGDHLDDAITALTGPAGDTG